MSEQNNIGNSEQLINKQSTKSEDFEILGISTKINSDTTIITSDTIGKKWLEQAMLDYKSKSNYYTSYYNDINGTIVFKEQDIDSLALNAQSNLINIQKINQIVRYYVNKDDLFSKVHDTIEGNVNNDFELKLPNYNRDEDEIYKKVEELINDFNTKINLKNLITKSIPITFDEGNYIMYLRKNSKNKEYQVDYYPLGIIEVSDYEINGEPYLIVNVNELRNRLKKSYKKTKKGKSLFFNSMEEEIKSNYPKEVYDAYMNKEQYAKLDIKNTGIIRINNMNRKYGLTPLFKALKPLIRLETIEESDIKNFRARGKKIIHQTLRKELFDNDMKKDVKWAEGMAYAHNSFIKAWANDPAIYTSPPWVEKIEYVEPKTDTANINTINSYRTKIMTALGIEFLNAEKGSLGTAQISITELMKTINKISQQLEDILVKWYQGVLIDNGIDIKYCPTISVIDSELLSTELKLKLADTMFNKFGMSFKSTYELLGKDFETEKMRRESENEESLDTEVFYARSNAYTYSAKGKEDYENEGGRPPTNEDLDKQEYDKQRNIEK